MSSLQLLYEISIKDIDVLKEKELFLQISTFGNIETKSLLLYKIKEKINSQNYPIVIDILNLISETTEFSEKTMYIYKYFLKILEKLIDFIVPSSLEYYKTIILTIKTIKLIKNKIYTNSIINKILNKMEEVDRITFLRYMFSNLNPNSISSESVNIISRSILTELEKCETISESYFRFLENLRYPPYIANLTLENIVKIIEILSNFKKKIRSMKIRKILVDILYAYINKKEIEFLAENFEKFRYNLFTKYLVTVRIIREVTQNPELINNSRIKKLLSHLSFDKNSLIRSHIFSSENLPLYLKVNSFKIRKYNVEALKKYLENIQ
ncbi:MAG: hypothetical protein RMJ51_04860 [Candidatus Calescibacterium sp.]|nr:hypothetical protein [Candidatus Calescibacterium sp.]MCX7972558.1 hypothetical protein [bacterium]MDW8195549.1 hypothetical protein [Candidatus Calescibacterium sp.]